MRISDEDHRIAHTLVADALAAAKNGTNYLFSTGGEILNCFMDLWVKCVALYAEAFKLLACKGARELVSNRLERPLIEVTVLASQIQVVQDRQGCCSNLALGICTHCLAVTLSAAAVVGVLSIEAL